jgi:uncharacterized short protein YbdD (DUF466 family)
MNTLIESCRRVWETFRFIMGDDAYERYYAHHRQHHADTPLLDRREFYKQDQQAKWSGIRRCC